MKKASTGAETTFATQPMKTRQAYMAQPPKGLPRGECRICMWSPQGQPIVVTSTFDSIYEGSISVVQSSKGQPG